jgi:hypothetical protein
MKARTRKLQRGAGCLPMPIASRNIARNEPLYPAIHARFANMIGGRRTRKLRGGFSPSIMGPLIDSFHYIAPAVGLVAYKFLNEKRSKSKKGRRSHRRAK